MTVDASPGSPWAHTIPDLYAAQVRLRPEAVAVSCAGVNLTYAELDERSDRIAGWLRARGVGCEDVVALQLPRGIDLVAALLGILKAGAAYLSLEPDAPRARQEHMLAAVGAAAAVSDGPQVADLPTLRLPDGIADVPAGEAPALHPDNLAYISFTSGSTGPPKGVGVPHRAVARLVLGDGAQFGPDEVFLLLAPVSFDASTFELWGPLLNGGRLAVYPSGAIDIDGLGTVLDREGVTTLWLTSGLFHRMVDHRMEALSRLRQLLAGGDVLDPARVDRFLREYPSVRLINGYGPTENTTFASCNPITTPVGAYVPIGRAIAGTRLHVLDPALRPVEPGVQGELWIAGAGLGRGYVNDARATADRFLPDPFARKPGARMYRTGDLVRHIGEDDLEFLGRIDRQVKIRGYRVELPEVERAIAASSGVAEVVVVATHDGLDSSLVAYVLPDGTVPGHLSTRLRRELRGSLPPYMIPSVFVAVEEFPLNHNGKIDRSRLPVPKREVRDSDAEYVAAGSPTEQLICDMWAEALDIDRVGARDEFFEIGGNSLLAMDLMSRVADVVGVSLPYLLLLENPTVQEFAAVVDTAAEALGER
ncbi:non-ribosomal peptide synthetase [Micromonospora sp. NPDC047467]|uniref:non-ribosomal peptide synthetase n=1 Tax=Micromonospora sp. NPDC047467 TaxID=3154814 RepID=UPI00340E1ACF